MTVNLLWTGGWDSTFRLLDLVVSRSRQVQPVYLLAKPRHAQELATMEAITAQVEAQFGKSVRDLILETRTFDMDAIARHPGIVKSLRRLRARWLIGGQYEGIVSFAESAGFTGLEMSVHVDDRVYAALEKDVVLDGDAYVLTKNPDDQDLHIFSYFRFPVLMLSKRDMESAAKSAGFSNIMDLTVFCHQPDRYGRPCGYCNPCSYAIREGMGRRIPWSNYVRALPRRYARQTRRAIRLRTRLRTVLNRY